MRYYLSCCAGLSPTCPAHPVTTEVEGGLHAAPITDQPPGSGRPAGGGARLSQPPPETTTTHEHNATDTFIDVVPSCTVDPNAPAYEITLTYNEVEHITDFGDGRSHETFTQTGTFVAVPVDDPSLPTYTGKVTIWGGCNANGKTVNGTFTITVHGTGTDGSSFKVHETDHFNTTPTGAEFFFTRCHD